MKKGKLIIDKLGITDLQTIEKIEGDKIYYYTKDGSYYVANVDTGVITLSGVTLTGITIVPEGDINIDGTITNTAVFRVYTNFNVNITNLCTITKNSGSYILSTPTVTNNYVRITATGNTSGTTTVYYFGYVGPVVQFGSVEMEPLEVTLEDTVKIVPTNVVTGIILSPTGATIQNQWYTGYTYTTKTGLTRGEASGGTIWLTGPWVWTVTGITYFSGATCPCIYDSSSQWWTKKPTPITVTGSSSAVTFNFVWLDKKNPMDIPWYTFNSTGGTSGTGELTWFYTGMTCCNVSGCTETGITSLSDPDFVGLWTKMMNYCWVTLKDPYIWSKTVWFASGATGIQIYSGYSAFVVHINILDQSGASLSGNTSGHTTAELYSGNTSINIFWNQWSGDLLIYPTNNQTIPNGYYTIKFTYYLAGISYGSAYFYLRII